MAADLAEKVPAVGQLCWEWLLTLMLNWGTRGQRADEMWIPLRSTTWSPAQGAVAQRVQCCVAYLCAGDRRAEVQLWRERSLRRGPGHYGLPLQQVCPLKWDAIHDAFENRSLSLSSPLAPAFSEKIQEPVKWTRAEVTAVHRTGNISGDEGSTPEVLVEVWCTCKTQANLDDYLVWCSMLPWSTCFTRSRKETQR